MHILCLFFLKSKARETENGTYNDICFKFETEAIKNENNRINTYYIEKYGFDSKKISNKTMRNEILNTLLLKIYEKELGKKYEYLLIEIFYEKGKYTDEKIQKDIRKKITEHLLLYRDVYLNNGSFQDNGLNTYECDVGMILESSLNGFAKVKDFLIHRAYFKTHNLKNSSKSLYYITEVENFYEKATYLFDTSVLIYHDFFDIFGLNHDKENYIREGIKHHDIQYDLLRTSLYRNPDMIFNYSHNSEREYTNESKYMPYQINLLRGFERNLPIESNFEHFIFFSKKLYFKICSLTFTLIVEFELTNFNLSLKISLLKQEDISTNSINFRFDMEIVQRYPNKIMIESSYYNTNNDLYYKEFFDFVDVSNFNLNEVDFYSVPEYIKIEKCSKDIYEIIQSLIKKENIDLNTIYDKFLRYGK